MQKKLKSNYRDLLKEILEENKTKNPKLSQSYYAQKIGTSRSFLNLVFTKKKHLSLEKLDLLCRYLKISPEMCLKVLRSFLQETSKQKYLTQALKNYISSFEIIQNHHRSADLELMSKLDKQILSSPLRSIIVAICAHPLTLTQIHESIHDKSTDRKMVLKALSWLVENGYVQKISKAEENYYQATALFLKTDLTNVGIKKYLPWLPVIEDSLNHPEYYRPGRIQSFTLSFDDAALVELSNEFTRLADRIFELSEKSEKTKAVYIQSCVLTLASR